MNNEPKVLVNFIFTRDTMIFYNHALKNFKNLKFKNKLAVFSFPNDFDGSKPETQGVNESAALRGLAVDYANKHNVKWILFVNPSLQLESDTIEKLLAVEKPLVGAMICPTNDVSKISGNNYVDRINFKTKWLKQSNLANDGYIDHVPDDLLLIACGVYTKIDFTKYTGCSVIKNRNTSISEWLQIEYYKKFKILPFLCTSCCPWYYNQNGMAYAYKLGTKVWMVK